jgi:uncharacterized protein YkwD
MLGGVLVARHRPVVLLLLAFALLVAPAIARADNCTPDASWGTLNRAIAQQAAVQLNQQRAANGLGALALSPTLTASAEWKSLHMARYDYFDHNDPAPPKARTAGQRMVDCGYTSPYSGENIAAGFNTASSVMDAWMNSPGHRANILGTGFTVMGIGAGIDASGIYYWTVDFGAVADAGTVPVGTAPAAPAPPATTTPPPVTTPPPPVTTPPVTTAPTTPAATVPKPTPVKSTTPATTGTSTAAAAVAAAAAATSATAAVKPAIGIPITNVRGLVAVPDKFHLHPGRPKILHPLGNDQKSSNTPVRIIKILAKPHGSTAQVMRDGQTIRLRLPRGAHGTKHLVYMVTNAAGELASGVVTIITRQIHD